MWFRLILPIIGKTVGLLLARRQKFWSLKIWEISCLTEKVFVSEEGFCSIELELGLQGIWIFIGSSTNGL